MAQKRQSDCFETIRQKVFSTLDQIVQASSLVETFNSILKPFINNARGQVSQELLNLVQFYHNHRVFKRGKRQNSASIELLTGRTLEKNWIVLLLLVLSSHTLIGQSFKYGVGLHSNFGYLVFDDKTPFEAVFLEPSISFNPGISLFTEFQSEETFQFRIAGQFSRNSINLSQRLMGGSSNASVLYIFTAVDLNVTARYLIRGDAGWKYLPNVGFNIGFSKYTDFVIESSGPVVSFGEILTGASMIEGQSLITPSLQLGIGIKPPFTIFRFPVELNCNFLFSPNDFLNAPMNVGTDNTPLLIQGKYHSLSIGLNFYLRRQKRHLK